MKMLSLLVVLMVSLLVVGQAEAMRSRKPQPLTDLEDINQLSELNLTLEQLWNITNGRYTLDNILIDPEGVRKGVAGDLVYASFGSQDHLCINRSASPGGTDWTCINIGTLSTCPGGLDTQVQFNDVGECGGDAGLTFDKHHDELFLGPQQAFNWSDPVLGVVSIETGNHTGLGFELTDVTNLDSGADVAGVHVALEPNYEGTVTSGAVEGVIATIDAGSPSGNVSNMFIEGLRIDMESGTFSGTNSGLFIEGINIEGAHGNFTGTSTNPFFNTIYSLVSVGSLGTVTNGAALIEDHALTFGPATSLSNTQMGGVEQTFIGSGGIATASVNDMVRGYDATTEFNVTSGTLKEMTGVRIYVEGDNSTGAVTTDVRGVHVDVLRDVAGGGIFTNGIGVDVDALLGTITNAYAIRMAVPTAGTNEKFGLYATNAVSGIIVAEGAVANNFETYVDFDEPLIDARIRVPNVTGVIVAADGSNTGNRAACWKTDLTLGFCSSAVGAGGDCTCN